MREADTLDIAVFSAKAYDQEFLTRANEPHGHNLTFFETRLNPQSSVLAKGFNAVCCFVNDQLDSTVLQSLAASGTQLVALRCAGFNNVDLAAAEHLGITVSRVPAYSPHAVAEHTIALILTLNRKTHRAYNRVREVNLSLDGLLGFDLNGKTVGIVGTGRIGAITAKILRSFGCRVLAFDQRVNPECVQLGVEYVPIDDLFQVSDIVSLHCPLTPETYHLINSNTIGAMKDGVMLINTSRGALIDTRAAIDALKSGKIGYLGLDVYEEEADLFFEDLSNRVVQDDLFARLTTFPNVLVTGHQAFFTQEALTNIAETTLSNVTAFEQGRESGNEVTVDRVVA